MTTDKSSDGAAAPPKPSARSSRPPRSRTTAASSSTSSSDQLRVGRIGRPHGLDGSFYVAEPDPALPGGDGVVFVLGAARRSVRRAGTTERPILRLEGSASREDADALRGNELTIPRSEAPLEEDEYWASDLAGCAVVDGDVLVGFVRRMSALPSVEVLEVDRADGSELLVPMVRDCIRSIDLEGRRIAFALGFLGEGCLLHAVPPVVRLVPDAAPRRERPGPGPPRRG